MHSVAAGQSPMTLEWYCPLEEIDTNRRYYTQQLKQIVCLKPKYKDEVSVRTYHILIVTIFVVELIMIVGFGTIT